MAEAVDFKYRAFLSYAHADAHRAAWLHLQLERFRLASDLIGRTTALGPVPTSLRPIFRDRDDFTGGQALGEATIAALDQAATLIVLCSEIAATRHAVNEEVRLFRWRHPDRPVIPVIISGTAPDNFPPALRFAVAADGAVTDRAETILGPDLRDEGDGRSRGLAKLVAGLIGVDTDEIVRRAERDQRRRQRNWIGGLSGLALVLAGLGVWAEINRREAVEQRGLAVTERSSSNQLRSVTSARLSEEQLAGGNTTEALRSALEGVAASDKPTAELVTAISRGILHQNRGSVLRSPADTAIGAFFSAGELVTTVGAEGHIAVWDASRPTPMRSFRSASVLRRAVMAPDGRHLVTSDQHGAVQIRSVTDLSVATRVSERPGHVAGLGFMAGGRQLAIVQSDGALSIIDPARVAAPAASDQPKSNGGIPVAEEAGGQAGPTGSLSIGQPGGSRITHAAFGQDRTIVIATSDAGVWTVNLSSPGTPTPVGQHDSPITSLSRSPDGRYALTTSLNGIAWLWDLTAKTPHRRVPVFDVVSLTASAFSTDGKLAAIGADTGSITIWDVGRMSRLATLDDHRGLIFQLSFDRSGRRLVSTSADGTTRVWIIRTPDQAEVTNLDQITSYQGRNSLFAASPDGSRFMAQSIPT